MPYTEFPFLPGVYKDDSPLSAEGFFVDADKIRFVRGKPQTIGGWEVATTDTLTGICRGIHAWLSNAGLIHAGFGTHLRLHAYFDGELYDITPVVGRGELSGPFMTTNASVTVIVTHAAHGVVDDQKVKFANATAVGGITINGEYAATYVDANSYTITHSSAATSSASGGGTVDYEYFLAPGQSDGTGGAGYGTGAYGIGGFGLASNGQYFPPTLVMSNCFLLLTSSLPRN